MIEKIFLPIFGSLLARVLLHPCWWFLMHFLMLRPWSGSSVTAKWFNHSYTCICGTTKAWRRLFWGFPVDSCNWGGKRQAGQVHDLVAMRFHKMELRDSSLPMFSVTIVASKILWLLTGTNFKYWKTTHQSCPQIYQLLTLLLVWSSLKHVKLHQVELGVLQSEVIWLSGPCTNPSWPRGQGRKVYQNIKIVEFV
jgi:hypothetical protein